MDGLIVDTVSAVDTLVQFTRSFVNDYDLTDTLDIDFLDLEDGFFQYSMENHTGLFLDVKGIHHDLWKTAYCKLYPTRQLEHKSDLDTASPPLDSGYFEGILMQSHTSVAPHTDQVFLSKNIAKDRMFPQWDSVQQRSETYVEYLVKTPEPTGQILNFASTDSIIFWIRSDFIWGERIRGRLAVIYDRTSDTTGVTVEYPPFLSQSVDSLRNRLVFDSVPASIFITTRMPGTAYLDTVFLDYYLWDAVYPADITSGSDTLLKARNNNVYKLPVDLTDIINKFPDSLVAAFNASIPVGSEVLIVSDEMGAGVVDALGRMTVKVDAHYQINIGLGYQVTDQTTVSLGTQMMDLGGYAMLSKLEQPLARMNLKMTNHTNVYVRLRCLMAPEELAANLDSLAENDMNYLSGQLAQSGKTNDGYINLLGPNGVVIPSRGGSRQNQIVLTEAMLDVVFKARDSGRVFIDCDTTDGVYECDTSDPLDKYESKAAMYWQMQLEQMTSDALHDTDFVRINASFYLEGIANTDSLFREW
jgi:hypothetical protein